MSTVFISLAAWKDVGLSVSITHPSSVEDRSITIRKQCSCVLNTNKTQRLKETRKEDTELIFKPRSKSLAEIYFIHKRQEAMYNGVMMKME